MTETEIALLILGMEIGGLLMLLTFITLDALNDRRTRKAIRAAEAQLKAAREKAKA